MQALHMSNVQPPTCRTMPHRIIAHCKLPADATNPLASMLWIHFRWARQPKFMHMPLVHWALVYRALIEFQLCLREAIQRFLRCGRTKLTGRMQARIAAVPVAAAHAGILTGGLRKSSAAHIARPSSELDWPELMPMVRVLEANDILLGEPVQILLVSRAGSPST